MATYNISSFADLQAIESGGHLADDCVLQNNIDGSGADFGDPIGNALKGVGGSAFSGTFDGQGYTLSNFSITQGSGDYCASLFGYVTGEIYDFTLDDVQITFTQPDADGAGVYCMGAIVVNELDGTAHDIHVEDCDLVLQATDASDPSDISGGGFVNKMYDGSSCYDCDLDEYCTLEFTQTDVSCSNIIYFAGFAQNCRNTHDCFTKAEIEINYSYWAFGGAFSYFTYGPVYLCYCGCDVTINVNSNAHATAMHQFGGFAYGNVTGELYSCWVTGDQSLTITGTPNNEILGGFMCAEGGGNDDAICHDCYTRMDVDGGALNNYSHGFIGFEPLGSNEYVEDCYSTGAINTGATYYAGFAEAYPDPPGGRNGTFADNFFDYQLAGTQTSDYGTDKTTAQMKTESTFTGAGWDFTNVWDIDGSTNDGYPFIIGAVSRLGMYGMKKKGIDGSNIAKIKGITVGNIAKIKGITV